MKYGFVNVFNWFIPEIKLKTLRFRSSVLFGTHALLNKSLIVIQLTAQLSNSTEIDSGEILDCIH